MFPSSPFVLAGNEKSVNFCWGSCELPEGCLVCAQRLCQVLDDKQLPHCSYSNQQCTIYTDCNRIYIVTIKHMFSAVGWNKHHIPVARYIHTYIQISTIYQLHGTYIHTYIQISTIYQLHGTYIHTYIQIAAVWFLHTVKEVNGRNGPTTCLVQNT
jgi:hypothetical protein